MPTQNQVIFGLHTKAKSIWTIHTEPNQSILKLKKNSFCPVNDHQVNLDIHTKTESVYFDTREPCLGAHKNKVIFERSRFVFPNDNPFVLNKA